MPPWVMLSKVGHDGRDAGGPGVFEGANEKQKPAKFVVCTFGRTTVKALHDIDIRSADGIKWSCLVLTILELAFLMLRERLTKSLRNCLPEFRGCLQRKES
jgi:hypothetical protein